VFGKLLDGSSVTEADSNEVTECCPCNDDPTTTTDAFGIDHVCLSVCLSAILFDECRGRETRDQSTCQH